jgi:thiol:disulfide interchange protein DsbC
MNSLTTRGLRPLLTAALALLLLACSADVPAQEDVIRKALAERIPNFPPINAVSPTPVPGIWEVRYAGTEILYTDAKGDHIFVEGVLLATDGMVNLTQASLDKVLAVDFAKLPLKDAIVIKQGTGARRMAVFADPNCGFCRRFERDIAELKDVTIYTFLIPILGGDSMEKSRDVWCARDAGAAWRGLMVDGMAAPKAPARCDSRALERNLAFAREHGLNSTPATIFENGVRRPGAIPMAAVEQLLLAAAADKAGGARR